MKRRDFFKAGAFASTALALNFKKILATNPTQSRSLISSCDLAIVTGGEPDVILDKALTAVGGIDKYIKKGQNIVIKPNIGWMSTPETAANTNPDLIMALVRKCKNAGANKVTVFDHSYQSWQKCYKISGIADAIEKAGGIVVPADKEEYYEEVPIPNGINLKSAKVHKAMIEADAWINVPVLKNHKYIKMECALKNYMGIVWDRRFFHNNDLQQCLADICTWEKRPVLNIVDAYRVMYENGPQGKSPSDVTMPKTVIVSPNIIAVESAALALLNEIKKTDIASISYIKRGESAKLGKSNLEELTIGRVRI